MIDRAIILAAGQGSRLRPLTDNRPKAMVEIMGRPMLDWQIASLRHAGIKEIVVVGGYCSQTILRSDVVRVDNPDFDRTNMIYTLACANEHFGDGFILAYSDILYNPALIKSLRSTPGDISLIVDRQWLSYWKRRFTNPLDDAETLKMDSGCLSEIGQKPKSIDEIQGQFVGLVGFCETGVRMLSAFLEDAKENQPVGSPRPFEKMYTTDLLQSLILQGTQITAESVDGGWLEIDSPSDLEIAQGCVEQVEQLLRINR